MNSWDIMSIDDMIHICSGITSGRVLNVELYVQKLQKLIYLHLRTGCFMKLMKFSALLLWWLKREIFMKQPVSKCRKINFCNLCVNLWYCYKKKQIVVLHKQGVSGESVQQKSVVSMHVLMWPYHQHSACPKWHRYMHWQVETPNEHIFFLAHLNTLVTISKFLD